MRPWSRVVSNVVGMRVRVVAQRRLTSPNTVLTQSSTGGGTAKSGEGISALSRDSMSLNTRQAEGYGSPLRGERDRFLINHVLQNHGRAGLFRDGIRAECAVGNELAARVMPGAAPKIRRKHIGVPSAIPEA